MSYVAVVTLDLPRAQRISRDLVLISGICDITTYDATGVEITDITKYFTKILRCIADGISDNGYLIRWNTADKCFHAFYPFHASGGSETADANNTLVKVSTSGPSEVAGSGTTYGQPGVECVTDDVGEFNFIAFGY